MRRTLVSTLSVTAVLLAGCATDDGSGADPEQDTAAEEAVTEAEPEDTAEADEVVVDDPEPTSDLPDSPQAHSSLYTDGVEPDLNTNDGEVAIAAIARANSGSFPMIVHNGTDQPISRVEVSGAAVGSDGTAVSSGRSQGFEPNVIEPGGIGIGYVYVTST